MAVYAVNYVYTDDEAKRDEFRAEHREYLAASGIVLLSGPLGEPDGALIVVKSDSAAEVAAVLDRDPFKREGAIAERTIRPYKPVLGEFSEPFGPYLA